MGNNKDKAIDIGYYDHLIINIADGKVTDLSELYLKLKTSIFAFALSILRDYYSAEDVMQETFLKVTVNAKEYQKGTNAKAWIFSIARNLCLDRLRIKKGEELTEKATVSSNADFEEKVASTIDFNQMLEPLDETERQIIALRFSGELKNTQIAEIINMSPVNVRTKYSRALKKLKAHNNSKNNY